MVDNHIFCRGYLKEVMKDVRKHVAVEQRKNVWTHKMETTVEFHGPDGFYWYGRGCCMWHARAYGWNAYLRKLAREGNNALEHHLFEFEKEEQANAKNGSDGA